MKNSSTLSILKKESILSVTTIALAFTLPILTHALGIKGNVLLPIYFAVVIGSFFLESYTAVITALSIPFLSSLITGMPQTSPIPMLQMLTVELTVLAILISILKTRLNVPFTVFTAIIVARISSTPFILISGAIDTSWFMNNLVVGLPGIILNGTAGSIIVLILRKKLNEK
jgi:hypothetical protein